MLAISTRIVSVGLVVFGLVGCGKNDGSSGQRNAANSESADEAAALASPEFTANLVLRIGSDGNASVQALAAMNGVDTRPTYGAVYESSAYIGCSTQSAPVVSASIDGYNGSDSPVNKWMWNQGYFEDRSFGITYSHASMAASYGDTNVFHCTVLSDRFADSLPPAQRGSDIHSGITVEIAHRVFDGWTYKNRYETPVAGRGSVKVFAGTLSYHMQTATLSGIRFSDAGAGSATIKMYLDPDTGRWVVASFEHHDPDISFVTN